MCTNCGSEVDVEAEVDAEDAVDVDAEVSEQGGLWHGLLIRQNPQLFRQYNHTEYISIPLLDLASSQFYIRKFAHLVSDTYCPFY